VLYEAAGKWIAVDVTPFLDSFLVGEYVEVVEARLPEGSRLEPSRDGDLERLHGYGKRRQVRLAYEQVYVFRHGNVSIDCETVIRSNTI